MDTDIPRRPDHVSREEARSEKERRKLFAGALKAEAKASGWRHANGGIFRQHGDWFVSVLPSPLWGRGVLAMSFAKPMAVDPMFWRIVGLPENDKLPLSFRANGAWVLRPPFSKALIALDEREPERLAREFVTWSTDGLAQVATYSVETLLAKLEGLGPRRKSFVALEICLHLLRNDFASAQGICRDLPPNETGGFMTGSKTFIDQAKDWFADGRRTQVRLVQPQ
jgi:hypothetical protein